MQWRLIAADRRHKRTANQELLQCRRREEALHGQIDVFKEELQHAHTANEEIEKKLKAAFVKGVCALNREAVFALREGDSVGEARPDGSGGDDVAAIEEILTRDHSRRHSSTGLATPSASFGLDMGGVHNPKLSKTACTSGVCPVHHVDHDGNYFHRCYAPRSCEYAPGIAGLEYDPARSASSNPSRRTHQPIIVHADPKAARRYDAGPPLRLRR